jgi:hypothetical protein
VRAGRVDRVQDSRDRAVPGGGVEGDDDPVGLAVAGAGGERGRRGEEERCSEDGGRDGGTGLHTEYLGRRGPRLEPLLHLRYRRVV